MYEVAEMGLKTESKRLEVEHRLRGRVRLDAGKAKR
jgi:hypothetical protein